METKKHKNKDAKTYRVIFFLIGMCISVGSVYAIMEYKKYERVDVLDVRFAYEEDEMMIDQTAYKEEPKKIIKPKDIILKVIPDNKKIEDIQIDLDMEPDDTKGYEDIKIVDEGPEETGEPIPWYIIQERASFPGGAFAMDKFIEDNLVLSDFANEEAENGTVKVSFTVEKDGSLSNIRITSPRKIGFGVIKKMPKWNPALQRDKPARMLFTKPIRLRFN